MTTATINVLPYLVLALLLGGMFIGFIWHVSVMGLRNAERDRELVHQERLRAIECGVNPEETKAMSAAVAIGVGAPAAAFGCAVASTLFGSPPFAWPAAAMVGVAGVICGAMLAFKSPEPVAQETAGRKPVMDPDAFEMAGHHH